MPEHITELSYDEVDAVSGGNWFFASQSQNNFASVGQNAQSWQAASNFAAYGVGNVQANVQVATNTNNLVLIQTNF